MPQLDFNILFASFWVVFVFFILFYLFFNFFFLRKIFTILFYKNSLNNLLEQDKNWELVLKKIKNLINMECLYTAKIKNNIK